MNDSTIRKIPHLINKCDELAKLLIECRDAITLLPFSAVRLGQVSSSLADRIDSALEPWVVKPGEEGYDTAI